MAMSKAHKEALADGRRQAAAIKRYLEAMAARRPGRPITVESLKDRIAKIAKKMKTETDPLRKVELVQARMDAEDQLRGLKSKVDIKDLEADFIKNAKPYSERRGISYSAWREAGVSAEVLRKAGIPRTRRD